MLVFVCETVTGGDHLGSELPASLIAEGMLMRDTLIGDLEDLPGVRVVTTHDARLPAPARGTSTALRLGDDAPSVWNLMAEQADVVWPIAPETDGRLELLAEAFRARARRVLLPDQPTLALCASKWRTAAALSAAGVPAIPTWWPDAIPESAAGPFVVKPDDGAGASGVRILDGRPTPPFPPGLVAQPLVEGTPASLTLLCQSGRTYVLAANRQHVEPRDGAFHFSGVTVGAFPVDAMLADLGARIGAALPGLHGIVGADYIATPAGPVVVEVNPRLTTAYAGLRRALGVNPLAFVAELIRDGEVPEIPRLPPAIPVEVLL
ncbi:ATP-grasp domain-containing protein [Starkeya koreensis]|uniref:ATP-grasp domain-containing protein n=1 Tax=Ancylobacter koreensis TaxID=266121 RepID=A0ABT0DPE1_9HYPH|nr:ATP-grasp domain-containing protein [Ancylobacter koreensis]MCK0208982.1 ATP-grasp domain-containing protein [Ancylobacter koreensis]